MKMTTDKRNKLIAVSVVLLMALVALGYFIIYQPAAQLKSQRGGFEGNEDKTRKMKRAVAEAPKLEADLLAAQEKLATIEREMPSGDLYSWFIGTIKNFKTGYRVDIPSYGTVTSPETVTMLPKFPYKQVRVAVVGTAFYQDFGHFLCDFENRFPYMRVENVSLDPSGGQSENDREKLNFRMDVIALISVPDDPAQK